MSPILLILCLFPMLINVEGNRVILADGNYANAIDENGLLFPSQPRIRQIYVPTNVSRARRMNKSTIAKPMASSRGELVSNTTEELPVFNKEKRREEFYKKVQDVPIPDEQTLGIFQHWTDQAFSNLFALIANEKLKAFKKPIHDEFGECSKKAKTVPMHAKCLSDLLNDKFDGASFYERSYQKTKRFDKYRLKKRGQFRQKIDINLKKIEQIGSFRMLRDSPMSDSSQENSRHLLKKGRPPLLNIQRLYAIHRRERRQTGIVKKNFYELLTPSEGRLSPIGRLAQDLMKKVLKKKGKEVQDIVPWQKTVDRIQKSANRRKAIKKELEEGEVNSMDQLTYRGMKRQGAVGEDLHELMENPAKLRAFLGKKRAEKGKSTVQKFVGLLREGIKLGYAFAGKNSTDLENKTMRMVSPRFLSVTPEDDPEHNETIDFLSPSLFSIHNEGKGVENLTSIPNLFKNIGGPFGFNAQDQQMWMDFIMEASGVIENAEIIEAELNNTLEMDGPLKSVLSKNIDVEKYQREMRAKDGTPLFFTKKNISDGLPASEEHRVDTFEMLHKKIDKDQIREMNKTGFALLSKEQLKLLYGPTSAYSDPQALQRFLALDKGKMLELMMGDIHAMAEIKSLKITPKRLPTTAVGTPKSRRKKRQVILSPISFTPFVLTFLVLNPLILSPILFSPLILAPAVLGPVILSPWAFVPVILSPRVLSPLILSPVVFAPIVLSPLALHPAILTPGAFVPFVLSPLVLSPFILSPQVFTPLILSPFALSPFILNPSAASPLVLSPYVLSPIIYSPQFFSALVLSPYALSPIIQSPLVAFSVILSPSYLS